MTDARPASEPRRRAAAAPLIVAIDGPSGVGKSTVARLLANRLGVPVLDTGATYRAVALRALEAGVDPDDRDAVIAVAERSTVDLSQRADGSLEVTLDGRPVGERIRTPEVSAATSKISVHPEIRRRLVALQRRTAERLGAVVEGRDIGTVVFPHTPHKFFLHARPEVRARRRWRELAAAGRETSFEDVLSELTIRDERDSSRRAGPLVRDNHCEIDTSDLAPDRVVETMLEQIRGR